MQEQKSKPSIGMLNLLSSNENIYNETTFKSDNNNSKSPSSSTSPITKSIQIIPDHQHHQHYNNGQSRKNYWKKYGKEIKSALPYRFIELEKKQSTEQIVQTDQLNCFQYVFFTWMTPLIKKIFKKNLELKNLGKCSPYDCCNLNYNRLDLFWKKQCNNYGLHNASLQKTLFQFIRTRFLMASLFYILCLATGYLSSTFFIKKLLEELENILIIGSIDIPTLDKETNQTELINYGSHTIYGAIKWIILLYLCEFFRAISFSIMFAISIRTGIRCVNALNGIIYKKILTKISNISDYNQPIQQPHTLFSNDLWKIFQMIYMIPLMIGSPIIIVVTIIYTYLLIGNSAFYGLALFMLIFLLQFSIIKWQTSLRKRILLQTDHRLSLINQFVKHIRTIKFYSWEIPFQNEIQYCRQSESTIIRRYQFLQCFSTSLALLAPMLITIMNILVHTWLENDLTVSTAFSLLMLNYIAAHGIRSLPNYFREITNGRVAMQRVERFLQMDDQKSYVCTGTEQMVDEKNAIEIVNCTFFWSRSNDLHSTSLPNITLLVPKRSHICLYGPIGSGKTALLLSIMGQTQCSVGQVLLFSPKIAFVSQKPWLQNATIKENILFGLPLDKKRYFETLIKCCLTEDISLLADGEDTIIGENGVKLSGGQKHRIALARAIYSDADIYLIDDCFSSLDSRVLKTIFNNVINGLLKNKTVLFVTRHLYLLDSNDIVLKMDSGQIKQMEKHSKLLEDSEEYRNAVEQSKIINEEQKQMTLNNDNNDEQQLISDSDLDSEEIDSINQMNKMDKICDKSNGNSYSSLISLMAQYNDNDDVNDDDDYDENDYHLNNNNEDIEANNNRINNNDGKSSSKLLSSKKIFKNNSSNNHKSINLEQQQQKFLEKKTVSWSVYSDYIQSSGGWFIFIFMLMMFMFQASTLTFSNWWLSYWLEQGSGDSSMMVMADTNENATETDENTKQNLSKNSIIANPWLHFYQLIYLILFFIVICTSTIMGIVFVRVITRAANRLHQKILSKMTYSPILFFDSIKIGKIITLFNHNMDELDNQLPAALDGFLQRSLLVLGNFTIIIVMLYWFSIPFILFVVVFYLIFRYYRKAMYWLKQADMRLRSPINSFVNSTLDGLSIIKAFRMETKFQENFYKLCDQQIAANYYNHCAVRWLSIRIDFICVLLSLLVTLFVILNLQSIGSAYAGLLITQSLQLSGLLQLVIRLALELETRLVSVERINNYVRLMKREKSVLGKECDRQSLLEWPNQKRISFREVSLRYRKNSPLVLNSVSFDIKGGQKFGIIGRTGAGKSSITYALFRLVEICSGAIFIDNLNIQSIPLQILRSKLSIIPQDPVIFQRSIRKNLDPSLLSKDEDLIKVLEQVKLSEKILSFKNGLDEIINEEQFSTGEKQLLCMARALLRKSKIIVLDEATSSMDNQTENDIWEIVLKNFIDCTVILIAHRLQTVQKCDQLIVIQNGQVLEQGNPMELQKDSNSYFSKMISKA